MDFRTYWQNYSEKFCDVGFSCAIDEYLCYFGLPIKFDWLSIAPLSHFNIRTPEISESGLIIGGYYGIKIYVSKSDQFVYAYDPSYDEPIAKLNNGLPNFLHFLMIYVELIHKRIEKERVYGIIEEIYSIDPTGFENPKDLSDSWWGYYFRAMQEEMFAVFEDEGK